jgi:hypothetical protein
MSLTRANYSNIFSRVKPRSFDAMQISSGAPTAPTLNLQFDRTLLTWNATSGLSGAATAYIIEVEPSGPTISIAGTSATVTGMSVGTNYKFTVFAVNSAGNGPRSNQVSYTHQYNDGSGGNITTFARSGSGQWRSHRFFSNATLTLTRANENSETLVVSGGQGGGYCHPADCRGPGAAGPAKVSTQHIPLGARSVVRGGGGGGGAAVHQSGGGGGASSISGIISSSGGGTVQSLILDGVNRTFPGAGYGGGGAACYLCTGQAGQPGVAVAAYRIS